MDVAVITTFEDFDETLEKRLRGPGSGRKSALRSLLTFLAKQPAEEVRSTDLLILDWKNPPKDASKEISVSLGSAGSTKAHWGSRDQLLTKFPSSAWDVVICSQTRRFVLDFAGNLKARRRATLCHGYDLPVGPWGQEQTADQVQEHLRLCEKFEFLCASQHLTDYVEKWGEGRISARCCYAADYSHFDNLESDALKPWEDDHKYVTCVSPCPEKGLCMLLGLALRMPETQFLVVKTLQWTKPWHEQLLKKYKNIKVEAATENISKILGMTRVLLAPSVYQEAFGLLVVESQLRGIPVISSDSCGLAEANQVPSMVIKDVPIVYDQRTRELVVGMTNCEAEDSLDVNRAGSLTMAQSRQTAINQENYQRIADEADVEPFKSALLPLLGVSSAEAVQQASQDARLAASSFVDGRRGKFLALMQKLMEEHVLAGDAKPMALCNESSSKFAPGPRVCKDAENEADDFDVNQDFTNDEHFDGMALASRCLVRLCEAGNLTVAAELLQAKADVNMPEPDIGVTPLIGAANAGHLDICKYLIRKEADVNVTVRDGTERTPLHAAAQMGFASVVQMFLENKADPRAQDLTKTTPLILAVRNGYAGATNLLLKHKANPNQSDDQGQAAINDAVAKDRFDLVTKLLEHGALVNIRNMAGLEAISFSRTPQMQSIIMKHDVNF